jgi:broad specificity phosphatase PhoE
LKWPTELVLIRHMQSAYNILRDQKENSALYQQFKRAYNRDYTSAETSRLADLVTEQFGLRVSDSETAGTPRGMRQALTTGRRIRKLVLGPPHGVIVSPYHRTKVTYDQLKLGWPELNKVRWYKEDEKARELEHGLALLYNDKRVFFAKHPEQKLLYGLMGRYRYQWPQGESGPDVRVRAELLIDSIIRNYAGLRVWVIAHHLFILALMAELEHWDEKKFLRMDQANPPKNCSVTIYRGCASEGRDGRLHRHVYNKVLYKG